jgi:hypothetical protein
MASRWMGEVLREGDLRSAWPLTHPTLRFRMSDAWVKANITHPLVRSREPNDLAAALAESAPMEDLWSGFAETQIAEFRSRWSDIDLDSWGWGTDPRAISPGRELAVLFDVGGEYGVMEADTPLPGLGLVMELTDEGWLVADFQWGEDEPPVGA